MNENTNMANMIAQAPTVRIPEETFDWLTDSVETLVNMHLDLIGLYERESQLKKHHRAYLHVRDHADQVCREHKVKLIEMFVDFLLKTGAIKPGNSKPAAMEPRKEIPADSDILQAISAGIGDPPSGPEDSVHHADAGQPAKEAEPPLSTTDNGNVERAKDEGRQSSGREDPPQERTGGVIVVECSDRESLNAVLEMLKQVSDIELA